MSRDFNKLAGAVLVVLRLARGRLGLGGVVALVVLAVVYAAVVQPWVGERFGVELPSVSSAESRPSAEPPNDQRPPKVDARDGATAHSDTIDPADLPDVLTEAPRGAYVSPAGLRYTRGSVHGHRLAHLMHHARDDPLRDGSHGVFDEDDPAELVLLVDKAYTQAKAGRRTDARREDERTVYTVDLGERVGYLGGETGQRRGHPPARHVRLVIEGDRLITAYPVIP